MLEQPAKPHSVPSLSILAENRPSPSPSHGHITSGTSGISSGRNIADPGSAGSSSTPPSPMVNPGNPSPGSGGWVIGTGAGGFQVKTGAAGTGALGALGGRMGGSGVAPGAVGRGRMPQSQGLG
ncbi:unnamed protein product, partial [Discosporangium mesarthrocarpum]